MISHIKGILTLKAPTHIVVENQGLGWFIQIPLSSYKKFGNIGDEIRVLTHLHVREDAVQLFGFASTEEKGLFQLLISVSGVGPKLAQSILSGISVDVFKNAVLTQNIPALTSAPGVGKKTAERLVLELKDKIGSIETSQKAPVSTEISSKNEEALLALESLGYKRIKAKEAIDKIWHENPAASVEEVVRLALQRM